MAEWFKAAVLKTVERKFRGFESYSLRHSLAREATGKGFWAERIVGRKKEILQFYGSGCLRNMERWLSWLKARAC